MKTLNFSHYLKNSNRTQFQGQFPLKIPKTKKETTPFHTPVQCLFTRRKWFLF